MDDLAKPSQLGINPATGSYLSAKNRNRIFNFGSSPFGINSSSSISPIRTTSNSQPLTPVVNNDSLAINSLQEQISNLNIKNSQLTASLGSINALQNQINILRVSVNNLGSTLGQIGLLVNVDSQLEIQKDNQEIENERRLSQRSIREGKESELEQKIQNALVTPVREVSARVQGTLGSLMGFFGTLFVGWLTNQGIESLRASFNDNKRKLTDIKNSVISNLLVVGGIFSAFKFGIGNVFSTISRLSLTVGNFLLANTIGKLFNNLFKLIPNANPKTSTKPGGNSGKPGGKKPAGGFGTLIGTGMEAFQGNWLEAGLGAASFLPGIPGVVAKGAFWLEQGLDIFGKGVISEENNKPISFPQNIKLPDIKGLFKSSDNTPVNSTATKSAAPPKPMSPAVEAPKISLPSLPFSPNTSETSKPQEKIISPPSQPQSIGSQALEVKPQISLSPQASEFQFSSDKINAFDTFGGSNTENNLDFSKAPLYGRVKINTNEQNQEIENTQQSQTNFSNLAPIQSQRIQTIPFDIKPEPEPKPTIIYQKTSSKKSASGSTSLKTGSATNVPIIDSSNSDNMYTLYSQASYNVII
jgi:hypothetical protein